MLGPLRDEPHPEQVTPRGPAPADPRTLSYHEADRVERSYERAQRIVRRRRRPLARKGRRLAGAAQDTPGRAQPAVLPPVVPPAADHGPVDLDAEGTALPRWFPWLVLALAGFVEYGFWLGVARQSLRYGDWTSVAAFQAMVLALLFPVVVGAAAMLGTALGRLGTLPVGARAGWYRVRAALAVGLVAAMSVAMACTAYARFTSEGEALGAQPVPVLPLAIGFLLVPLVALAVHAYGVHPAEEARRRRAREQRGHDRTRTRAAAEPARRERAHTDAWLALEAEVARVVAEYQLATTRAERSVLRLRARASLHPREVPLRSAPARTAPGPTTWLDVPQPPALEQALEPSLRLLRACPPRLLVTRAPQRELGR